MVADAIKKNLMIYDIFALLWSFADNNIFSLNVSWKSPCFCWSISDSQTEKYNLWSTQTKTIPSYIYRTKNKLFQATVSHSRSFRKRYVVCCGIVWRKQWRKISHLNFAVTLDILATGCDGNARYAFIFFTITRDRHLLY